MMAAIVGWAHTPFGKLDAISVESLIVRVTREALDHAGLKPSDVDEIVLRPRPRLVIVSLIVGGIALGRSTATTYGPAEGSVDVGFRLIARESA